MTEPQAPTAKPRLLSQGQVHALSTQPGDRLISVILPVKNGAADLRELLPRILGQRCDDYVEIVAIDSGSVDDTVDILQRFGATVLAINPSSFNYGLTRNFATSYARGDVLVFVTTRSRPADNRWLANIVKPLDDDPNIAGVCGRSLPRPEADLLTRRDDLYYVSVLAPRSGARAIGDWGEYRRLTPTELSRFAFFSNVSAAIRPEVFARIPFREASHGEDMIWAKDVLEAGFSIWYERSAVHLRSHEYTPVELLQRCFDSGRADREIVGQTREVSDLLPTIFSAVENDWRYLEHGCRLEGGDLERWRVTSVLHRTAENVGLWLGGNEERLQGGVLSVLSRLEEDGLLTGELRGYLEPVRRGFGLGAAERGGASKPFGDAELSQQLFASVIEDWRALEDGKLLGPSDLDRARLDTALRRIGEAVGFWLGANRHRLPADLASSLSLIQRVRSGARLREMGADAIDPDAEMATSAGPFAAGQPRTDALAGAAWQADVHGLYAAIDAYEAEWLASRAELEAQVGIRDRMIRDLQAELQAKVGEANEVISNLQAELERKVGECNRIIRELQAELRARPPEAGAAPRAGAWQLMSLYEWLRQKSRRLMGQRQ